MLHTSATSTTIAQTIFRVALGSVLVAHGSQKLFGWFGGGGIAGTTTAMNAMGFRPAKQSAVMAGIGEAGAGAALALGLATPAAGAGAAITMGVAASVNTPNGFFASEGGLEYPALLGVAAAAFAMSGAGPISLDGVTERRLDQPWMRAVALIVIPMVIGMQIYRRRKTLATVDAASDTESGPQTVASTPATESSNPGTRL
ncbi:DoxX family protein [Cryobacterium sp. Hz9]|uniref:DoxX family protein n=1 Tax=Cryobacterium sp. Hz9 TaxID=1259167 RepID=UPI00106B447A|nr:DoxX family membrane protein [Cryobacterium sp. Hz9]TFB71585.1 DoxX family membrane protein [Cryobacterium sp. Hz9]